MSQPTYEDIENCPVRRALKVMGNKWVFPIVFILKEPKRYGEIKKQMPDISEKVLIDKLRLLEENNFVSRKDYKQVPPKVEYSLTNLGKEAIELVPQIMDIGRQMQAND